MMRPLIYDTNAVVDKFADKDSPIALMLTLAMCIGFAQYFVAIWITARNKRSAYPVHHHIFFLAHDLLYSMRYKQWFVNYGRASFFKYNWAGFVFANLVEIWSLFHVVKHERQEELGSFFQGPVSRKQAWTWIIHETVIVMIALQALISFTNDRLFLAIFVWVQALTMLMPAMVTFTRHRRVPGTALLAFLLLLGTTLTFLPEGYGLYATADPAYFSRWEFYALGAACVYIGVAHFLYVLSLPVTEISGTAKVKKTR